MAVAWTTIPTGDVDVDSPVTTALITALRDNPEGIAQRATGAPKIFGAPYDYQEFLSTGESPWTKPSNAESGDRVIVQVVGGGASGGKDGDGGSGGGGGGGAMQFFDDIDDLGATEVIVVGSGAVGITSAGIGNDAGDSSFGPITTQTHIFAEGGSGGLRGLNLATALGGLGGVARHFNGAPTLPVTYNKLSGGRGGDADESSPDGENQDGEGSVYGGGGGGGTNGNTSEDGSGGVSARAGFGGRAIDNTTADSGAFPGGGGGGTEGGTASGAGANGVVRVWCIKES